MDFIVKGCTFHVGQAITKAILRVPIAEREDLKVMLQKFFHAQSVNDLIASIKEILDKYPFFRPW